MGNANIELMASVVADMRSGRYVNLMERAEVSVVRHMGLPPNLARAIAQSAITVDVQAVYDQFINGHGHDVYLMKAAPPWANAILTYVSESGNTWAVHVVATDMHDAEYAVPAFLDEIKWDVMPPGTHTIDWDAVRWVMSAQVYLGGLGAGERVPTAGPVMIWRLAVYPDGSLADLNWSHIAHEIEMARFNNTVGVLMETLNMCSCTNVVLADAKRKRPRPQQRRLDRIGVKFSELHIRPVSKSYRRDDPGIPLADMRPMHGVRGHYSEYGVNGKGLLFGKLSGRYWIPPHVRGNKEHGEVEQSYVAES